jgi:hypothetical protein
MFAELDEACRTDGFDALAWYHPFHLSGHQWGIYIPMTSIHYGVERWFSHRLRRSRRASLAFEALLGHEVIHYGCEYSVAQFELLLRAACWAPARERLERAQLQWFNDEEALANASSIRRLADAYPAVRLDRLHAALLQSPPGYRDFPAALCEEGFEDHLLEVLRHNVGIPAVDLKAGLLDPAFDGRLLFPDVASLLGSCPLHLINDSHNFDLPPLAPRWVERIAHVIETDRFLRLLHKLDARRQEEWAGMKRQLAEAVPRHPKFKKLHGGLKGYWGIYLNDGFRVHLRLGKNGVWEAVEIGSHTAMGHG